MKDYCGRVAMRSALALLLAGSAGTAADLHRNTLSAVQTDSVSCRHDFGDNGFVGTSSECEIYYGLNDSHGHSWVQENNQGVVGITYFQRLEDGSQNGSLIYRTIHPDGTIESETVAEGTRLQRSVLLYDSLSMPHIFVAQSGTGDQIIEHYYKGDSGLWQREEVFHFFSWGGRYIYELSADLGPDNSFHLLVLKTQSDVDSDDYWNAWMNASLFHISNAPGFWRTDFIYSYNTAYTYDHYIKCSCRQDIEVDHDGYVHVVFSQQIVAVDDPSRLLYATNKSGSWKIETALSNDFGARDDAGWFPSLCLDRQGTPYVACMYVNRVYTYSAVYCKLFLLQRVSEGVWQRQLVAESDDGYYGSDGRRYTGALSHLVFDRDNVPHILFSDIASSHRTYQHLNVGNIRHAVYRGGAWNLTTIYRQPLPIAFQNATEMFGECLVVSDLTDTIRVIGQELKVTGPGAYSVGLVEFAWADIATSASDEPAANLPDQFCLIQNYPNPFNQGTVIGYSLPTRSQVTIEIFDILGHLVRTLVNGSRAAGSYWIEWDGVADGGAGAATGVYLYRLRAGDVEQTKKMLLIK